MKKIKCEWSKDSSFARSVIAHFILKENSEYKDIIERKVDEWFDNFSGSDYEGDCITGNKIQGWFDSYFVDLGCNKEHVIPYIKNFWLCFGDYGAFIHERYLERIGENPMSQYLDNMPFCTFKRDYQIYANSVFKEIIPDGKELTFNYNEAIRIIRNFDAEFDWLNKYDFNQKWKIAFCLPVDFISKCGCSDEERTEKEAFDKAANEFLDKHLNLEEMDTFLKSKICIDGKDTTLEEFFKRLFGDMKM